MYLCIQRKTGVAVGDGKRGGKGQIPLKRPRRNSATSNALITILKSGLIKIYPFIESRGRKDKGGRDTRLELRGEAPRGKRWRRGVPSFSTRTNCASPLNGSKANLGDAMMRKIRECPAVTKRELDEVPLARFLHWYFSLYYLIKIFSSVNSCRKKARTAIGA